MSFSQASIDKVIRNLETSIDNLEADIDALNTNLTQGPVEVGSVATQASTNSYVSAMLIENDVPGNSTTIVLKENNTNAVLYQILVSNDGTNYETLVTDQALNKNVCLSEIIEGAYRYIDVQIKSAVADTHGSVSGSAYRG